MNRRQFIQYICAGGVVLGMGVGLYSWLQMGDEAMTRSGSPELLPGLSEDEAKILHLASLAPSGHNAQPWRITIKAPQHWIIGTDKTRWLPAVDPENRETMLSIGAFMENLSVAAEMLGYQAEFEIVGKDEFSSEIAAVRLLKGKQADVSEKNLQNRRTLRKNLLKEPLKKEDINHLIASKRDSIFYYPQHSKEGVYISEAVLAANKVQVYRDDVQAELANWIRWSSREANQYNNGMTPESMEMEGVVRWYAKNFLSKEAVMGQVFRNETLKLVEKQVQDCAGWLVVSSGGAGLADLINAGRVLESTWLRASERLIAFHPMSQVLEEEPWRSQLVKELNQSGDIEFVIRIGYVENYKPPVSLRMPVSKIVVM